MQHWYTPLFRSGFVSAIQFYSNFAMPTAVNYALPVSLPD
ncbi:hypothetical protein COO91_02508 [Nostoc flagelliforme CCNUN1]|uniref:Uncharacterized protein n=1 Tax=Nostoc flagelliforme CCNUN1 TaxID=2038116 RepID=A0A2K8SMC7_9NOSO|nr:hypothetical protein COO91_02508 [Nostoc flagelliforme CCNUN1]